MNTTITSAENMIIESIIVGPFQTNIFVVGCRETNQAAVIDAGGSPQELLKLAQRNNLDVEKILQTHAHIDHVAALPQIKSQTNAPVYLHKNELPLYEAAPRQGMMFGMRVDTLPPVDHFLKEGQTISIGNLRAEVLVLPGHSPGSVAFYFQEQNIIFSGDVLFAGSIGRTDLPGGNAEVLKQSLARLKKLPPETLILSGHGPQTTIGQECKTNPFLIQNW